MKLFKFKKHLKRLFKDQINWELEGKGGLYLEHCQITPIIPDEEVKIAKETNFQNGFPFGYLAYAVDPENAKKLWTVTEEMIENARK